MDKILQVTSRGQVTIPIKKKNLEGELEDSWRQYKDGKFITNEDLMKKY